LDDGPINERALKRPETPTRRYRCAVASVVSGLGVRLGASRWFLPGAAGVGMAKTARPIMNGPRLALTAVLRRSMTATTNISRNAVPTT
jgi:hypothetical protein